MSIKPDLNKQELIDIFNDVFVDIVPANYLDTDPQCQDIEEAYPGVADEFISTVYSHAGIDFSCSADEEKSQAEARARANELGIKKVHALMDELGYPWGDRETLGLQQDLGEYLPLFKFFVDYLDGRIASGG